jgi:hypothetical protein
MLVTVVAEVIIDVLPPIWMVVVSVTMALIVVVVKLVEEQVT